MYPVFTVRLKRSTKLTCFTLEAPCVSHERHTNTWQVQKEKAKVILVNAHIAPDDRLTLCGARVNCSKNIAGLATCKSFPVILFNTYTILYNPKIMNMIVAILHVKTAVRSCARIQNPKARELRLSRYTHVLHSCHKYTPAPFQA